MRGRGVALTAEELKAAAKESVGRPNAATEIDITILVNLIEQIQEAVDEVDKK